VATAVTLVGLELVLRAWPTLLGQDLANGVLSKYTIRDGGKSNSQNEWRKVNY